MKTLDSIVKTLSKCKKDIEHRYPLKSLGIFGSYARGEARSSSDVDILIEISKPVSLLTLVHIENYLSDNLHKKVDLVPKHTIRPELRRNILKEVIYI